MQERFFSIIVVALNPGKRLRLTLDSIMEQDFRDYEVILKDGGSRDGSLEELENEGYFAAHPRILVVKQRDKGIYDAMNQAVQLAGGEYVQFLNCGDLLHGRTVLSQVEALIRAFRNREESSGGEASIYYGHQYNCQQRAMVYSAPQINDFTCYRNVPCHQVCFYSRSLFSRRGYSLKYRVRADYEHFLFCIYDQKAKTRLMPILITDYEGGGFSETVENRRCSAEEHREITEQYLGKRKVLKYRVLMLLTLAPFRTKMAESRAWSGMYNRIKGLIYGKGEESGN